jgi:ankyrin repeat protein
VWQIYIYRSLFVCVYINPYMAHDDPLWSAVDCDDHSEVRRLLDRGADVNMVDEDGQTLLHLAVYGECIEMVELLLQKGIDVNPNTNYHITPLESAAMFFWVAGVKLLILGGAKLDAEIPGGRSPLGVAIVGPLKTPDYIPDPAQQLDMVLLLIHSGADVFARQEDGETFLMCAAQYGNAGVVLALIAAGVDPEACDDYGNTAMFYAEMGEHTHIKTILSDEIHRRDASVAFAMGNLSRSGEKSIVNLLDPDMVAMILKQYLET